MPLFSMHLRIPLNICWFSFAFLLTTSCSFIENKDNTSVFMGKWELSEMILFENGKQVLSLDKPKEEKLIYIYEYFDGHWYSTRYSYGEEIAPCIELTYCIEENHYLYSNGRGMNSTWFYQTEAHLFNDVYETTERHTFYESNNSITLSLYCYSIPHWLIPDAPFLSYPLGAPIDVTFTYSNGIVYSESIIKQVYAVRPVNQTTSEDSLYDESSNWQKLILPKDIMLKDGNTHTYIVRFIYAKVK